MSTEAILPSPAVPRTRDTGRLRRALVFLIAGWSGFFVMAVELLSGRLLAPSFGNSIYVWGGVITVFMLALSIGYLLGGQLSLHSPSLRRLGALLIAAGVSTLPVVLFGDTVLDALFEHVADPRWGTLLASSALFFVPTVISGTVSPYAIRLLVTHLRASGRSAGLLYFVSTFGSAAGTLATSFYLVLLLEVNQIFFGLIAVSCVLGALALPFGDQATEDAA
ncbi:fused MFS/spermidine synthase [Chitinimonas koreensis]|uniref:fused MFS/spermidine synthase n=1 Tax=Chitinimonas koreensis TaxID=356302 RepID=UPI00041E4E05|nr:fused MFS/spermidine synthase [Chitinimonas koreensis]QNM95934.1 fused MFS/spermidine synthase [Chitinimonas koreensis]